MNTEKLNQEELQQEIMTLLTEFTSDMMNDLMSSARGDLPQHTFTALLAIISCAVKALSNSGLATERLEVPMLRVAKYLKDHPELDAEIHSLMFKGI